MASHPHKAPEGADRRARLTAWVRSRPVGWRIGVPLICAGAGLLAATSMVNARGTDLRGGRHTDLIGIVGEQRSTVQELRRDVRTLQGEVETLADQVQGSKIDDLRDELDQLSDPAGFASRSGAGLVITLDDAPRDQPEDDDIDDRLLVVHQQDLQAVVNALWAGGSEGISLMGQRIISTTGIKCVGSTVVLQDVPYSPPYRIAALGDPVKLYDAVQDSPAVSTYLQYTEPPYNLGWSLRDEADLTVPAFKLPVSLDYAEPATLP